MFTPNRPYKAKALAKHRDSDTPTLPDAIASGPMFRIQLYSSFLVVYFPTSVDDAWHSVVTSWPTQPVSTDLFQKSLTAWACISLGTSKCDQGLLLYGIRLYNQAIPIMSNMMRRDPYHDDIIYSLIIWTELEVSLDFLYCHLQCLAVLHASLSKNYISRTTFLMVWMRGWPIGGHSKHYSNTNTNDRIPRMKP